MSKKVDEMKKPIIFISHINEERKIAISLKSLLKLEFGDTIEIFVSSDKESIQYGDYWFSEIKKALSNCAIALILCSYSSIKEPWINFETGAALIRERRVIPLCYGGLEREKLPVPLSYLCAVNASDIEELRELFQQISDSLGIKIAHINIHETDFFKLIDSFKIDGSEPELAAEIKGGGVHKQGDEIVISGATSSPTQSANIEVFQELLFKPINIETDGTFLTQFATADFPSGTYGASIELPTGRWIKLTFSLE
jgi:hypothetical protein